MTHEQFMKNLNVPSGRIDCVLDTDTYNEIDDQFALSLMVKSEKCNVKALYAAPFFNPNSASPEDGMERSYDEILNLLTLMGEEELKKCVFKGSRQYLPDESTPVSSPAAAHLAEMASGYSPERPLYVVAIGAITNVASALLMTVGFAGVVFAVNALYYSIARDPGGVGAYFLRWFLPSATVTVLILPVYYYAVRSLEKKMNVSFSTF